MTGDTRRSEIINLLRNSTKPISGAALAERFEVSRQVIVQDIALLRANGNMIYSTNRGYLVAKDANVYRRVFKMYHSNDQVEEELNTIVDLGGRVEDIFISHRVYGTVRAEINIRSRKDVRHMVDLLNGGPSKQLSDATSGYHYHTIAADSEETLDQIFEALKLQGFLAGLQDYEPVNFWEK